MKKINKIMTLTLVALVMAPVVGCDNKPAILPMPEVSDANCAPDKIKAMPKDQQQEFSSLCIRRDGNFKPSPTKEW